MQPDWQNWLKSRISRAEKSVTLFDNVRLRAESISHIEQRLKALDRLEFKIDRFRAQDQRLFENWIEVTFRAERITLQNEESRRDRLQEICEAIADLAKSRSISEAKAFRLLRSAPIHPSRPSSEDEEAFRLIREMTTEKIEAICANAETGVWLLETALELSRGREHVFFEIWEKVPIPIRVEFGVRLKARGRSVESLLESHAPTPNPVPQSDDKTKVVYRKLARLLHPDRIHAEEPLPWRAKMWERVQIAYRGQKRTDLERLLRIARLRAREWPALSVFELKEAQTTLEQEMSTLEIFLSVIKRNPAWGFSKRSDLKRLEARVREDFRKKILKAEVESSKWQEKLDLLEAMESAAAFSRFKRPRKKGRRKKTSALQGSLFDSLD